MAEGLDCVVLVAGGESGGDLEWVIIARVRHISPIYREGNRRW